MIKILNQDIVFDEVRKIYTVGGDYMIDYHGIRCKSNMELPLEEISLKQQSRALIFTSQLKQTERRQGAICSYGLKHRVERYSLNVLGKTHENNEVYCSNGSLIGAMVQSGFNLWLDGDISLNCCFNYSKRSLNGLLR